MDVTSVNTGEMLYVKVVIAQISYNNNNNNTHIFILLYGRTSNYAGLNQFASVVINFNGS